MIPLECAAAAAGEPPLEKGPSSPTGAVALRRSQSWTTGNASSSHATATCVAWSGLHATADARLPCIEEPLSEMTGRCFFRSQTVATPPAVAEARMCGTLQFQASEVTSEPGGARDGAGTPLPAAIGDGAAAADAEGSPPPPPPPARSDG